MTMFKGIRQIGKIINSHGNKGALKVIPLTENLELFQNSLDCTLIKDGHDRKLKVIEARPAKNHWIIKIEGVDDIESAKALKGGAICVDENRLRPLAEDEFFIDDLLDAKVYSTENEFLGVITNYLEAGSQGVCEVSAVDGDFLFPTSKEVLRAIVPSEKVVIQLLPGLKELNQKQK